MNTFVKLLLLIKIALLYSVNLFAQTEFESGKAAYLKKEYQLAIKFFNKALEKGIDPSKSLIYRAASEILTGNLDQAQLDLDSSRNLDSNSQALLYFYGRLYVYKRQFSLAVQYFNLAIAMDSLDMFSFNERGDARAMLHDLVGAVSDNSKAISLDSTNWRFFSDRGFALLQLDSTTLALRDFDKAILLSRSWRAYANRGYTYYLLKKLSEGLADLSESLRINPGDAEVLYYRGMCCEALGNLNAACLDLKQSSGLGYLRAANHLAENRCP